MMLRRSVLRAVGGQARRFATEGAGSPPQGGKPQTPPVQQPPQQPPQQAKADDGGKAAAAKKAEEAAKAAAVQKAEEAKKAAEAKAAAEKKAAEERVAAAKKAEEEKKAAEAKKAEEAKKAAEAKEVQAAEAKEAVERKPASQDEILSLLAKQQAMLKRMAEDIEIARGERALQGSINGDVAIKDISRILQKQTKDKVDGITSRTKKAVVDFQTSLTDSGQKAIEGAVEQRKQLSRLNEAEQLPWQKDKPRELYMAAGRYLLRRQQSSDGYKFTTGLEVGMVLLVLFFWWLQRRKVAKGRTQIDAVNEDLLAEVAAAKATVGAARDKYQVEVLHKEEELREVQNFSAEQCVTLDTMTAKLYGS